NLLKLASEAYLTGFYYKPRLDKEILSQHKEGLVCLSGCLHSEISRYLVRGQMAEAIKTAEFYKNIFGDDYYLELQNHNLADQIKVIHGSLEISKELGIPIVATNDVHYLVREDARAHDILLCISTNKMVNDPNRLKMSNDEFYFKSSDEMTKLFTEIPESLTNTLRIAEKCNLELSFSERHLPRFTPPSGLTSIEYIKQLSEEGLKKRYPSVTEDIRKRLNYELGVIEEMGFIDYFLIVWDLIRFARDKNISVGPGRGSAAGSLLAYVLGITDVDPLKYNLLFERFMNPGRNEPPDIDIDFSQAGREQVVNYVRQKYGYENVAQIITFGTMKARAAVRDVGRVMGIHLSEVDRIAKKIAPYTEEKGLKKAINSDPELKELYETRNDIKELFDISMKLEGLTRHASTHAAGVVVADKALTNYVPLYAAPSANTGTTTQYSMDVLPKIGILKVDLLGIITLDVIDKCLEIVRQTQNKKIDIRDISLTDRATFELLSRAETKGVFQLESSGMRDLLRKMKPDSFEDIIAVLALYRPGPIQSGMVYNYIDGKHDPNKINYLHSSLEPIIAETKGVVLYQEQVMLIANRLGGFSLAEADELRKAMGKKMEELVLPYREQFVKGALKNKVPTAVAHKIFDWILFFAGYGFNKSHSTAYALTSYRTSYLKANYPVEYMAALMTCHRSQTDKVVEYIDECKRMGIEILPPDVNESEPGFTVLGKKIRFGLSAVKNVGDRTVDAVINIRNKSGKFISLYDFTEKVDSGVIDKQVVESLIKCGAFDSLKHRRSQLTAILEQALKIGLEKQNDRQVGQLTLLSGTANSASAPIYPSLPDVPEWPEEDLLQYEKEVLGLYVTGHPLVKYEKIIKTLSSYSAQELARLKEGVDVKIGGLITSLRPSVIRSEGGKSEKRFFFKLKDFTGMVDAVIYPNELKKYPHLIHNDAIVFLKGRLVSNKEEPLIRVKAVSAVEQAYEEMANNITINLSLTGLEEEVIHGLKDVFLAHPGTCPIFLRLLGNNNRKVLIKTGTDYNVAPSKQFMSDMNDLIGSEHLVFN
ncbi:MAG: DNA polymerase III subunit alpha, partial [Planctomycetota bacterium]